MKFINAVVALYEKVKGDVMKLYNVRLLYLIKKDTKDTYIFSLYSSVKN